MIISNQQVQSVIKAYGLTGTRKNLPEENKTAVSLRFAGNFQRRRVEYHTADYRQTPEVRLEKVAAIKRSPTALIRWTAARLPTG